MRVTIVLLQVSADSFPGKAALSFGIDGAKMIKAFCKPRIKVGTEWVTKGQTCKYQTIVFSVKLLTTAFTQVSKLQMLLVESRGPSSTASSSG